jgi:hypothetical protein
VKASSVTWKVSMVKKIPKFIRRENYRNKDHSLERQSLVELWVYAFCILDTKQDIRENIRPKLFLSETKLQNVDQKLKTVLSSSPCEHFL